MDRCRKRNSRRSASRSERASIVRVGAWSLPSVFLMISAVVLLAGCTATPPANDPFFGRTTIPPPATGAACGQMPDPYYQNPPGVQLPAGQASAPPPYLSQPGAPAATVPPGVQLPAQPTAQGSTSPVPYPSPVPYAQNQAATPPASLFPAGQSSTWTSPAARVNSSAGAGVAPNLLAPRPQSTVPRGRGYSAPNASPYSSSAPPFVPSGGAATPSTNPPGNMPGPLPYNSGNSYDSRNTPVPPPTPNSSAVSIQPASSSGLNWGRADDRMPRPVDNAPRYGAGTSAPAFTQTLPARAGSAPSPAIDISDLPRAR